MFLDFRPHGCGKMWDFLNVAERIKVREKVISEKPCIVMGSCLDCWQTGSRMDKRSAIDPVGPRAPLSA